MTAEGKDKDEATLWSYQIQVRHRANELRSCLIYEVETKQSEKDRVTSKIEDMIVYEIETFNILEETLAAAKRLGKE